MPYLTLLPHKFSKTCNPKFTHSPPGPKGSYLSWPGPLRDLKGRPTFNGTIRDLKLPPLVSHVKALHALSLGPGVGVSFKAPIGEAFGMALKAPLCRPTIKLFGLVS